MGILQTISKLFEGKPITSNKKGNSDYYTMMCCLKLQTLHHFQCQQYHKRGIELAQELRKVLSTDFDFWYAAPF